MPLHRVVKDSSTPGDDLDRAVRRLEEARLRVLQVIDQPGEWLIVTDSIAHPDGPFVTRVAA